MPEARNAHAESPFQKFSFLLILAAISAGFFYMVRHFVLTALMAAVFAGLCYPLYEFLLKRLRKPAPASLATLLLLLIVLVLPVSAVILIAYREAFDFFSSMDFAAVPGALERLAREAQARFPAAFSHLSPEKISQAAGQILKQAFEFVLTRGAGWSVSLAGNLFNFFLMLFMMFFFLMDGERILHKLVRWSPLRDDYEEVLLHKFLSVSRATLKGVLVVGVLQGAIGAILYWLVGLNSPMFLGVLMVFCTVVPVFGTSLVWIPVAIYLFLHHRIGGGIAVTVTGALIISVVDNLLRPSLVGKEIKMHDLLVLLSTLGGLALFGLPGFIMGPVLASLFLSIWTMYEEVFATELAKNRVEEKTT